MIRVEHLSFVYPERNPPNPLFTDLSVTINQGEWIQIIGPSASGKSTFLKLIKGILTPTAGQILINGKPENAGRNAGDIAYVGPNPENQIIGSIVEDDIEFSLHFLPISEAERKKRLDFILSSFDLEQFRKHFTHKLSGGEQQRLALASNLVMNPSVVLLDCCTSMLDRENKIRVFNFLKKYRETHRTTILQARQGTENLSWSDSILYFIDGTIRFFGSPKEFFTHYGSLTNE